MWSRLTWLDLRETRLTWIGGIFCRRSQQSLMTIWEWEVSEEEGVQGHGQVSDGGRHAICIRVLGLGYK